MRGARQTAIPAAAVWLASCTGVVLDPRPAADVPSAPPVLSARPGGGGTADAPACGGQPRVGASPLRRLSRREYNDTVRDLLGDTSAPGNAFPDDAGQGAASLDPGAVAVSPLLAQGYQNAAQALAVHATMDLRGLMGCDPSGGGEAACVGDFIRRFGRKAYRRPLTPDEVTRLTALYGGGRTGGSVAEGVALVVQSMLQSPSFVYRLELGGAAAAAAPGATVRLTSHEVAARLSYFLWGSTPDGPLSAAADADQVRTAAQVAAQARRMLGDPRARSALAAFYQRWLGLDALASVDRDRKQVPDLDLLKPAMAAETGAFVAYVTLDGDARLATLLTGSFSLVDASLARLYGVAPPAAGAWARVDLPPAQRAGLITQPALLAVHSHADQTAPVLRGKLVREQFLCEGLPNPPPNVNNSPPAIAPGTTTRQRFAQHSSDPSCSACHRLIDPIGLGFESYDTIGRFRATDQGQPVDASGEVVGSRDLDGGFRGVPELARKLADSDQVRQCVAAQWFRYAFGRIEGGDDACSVQALGRAFAASGYDMRELMVSLTGTDAFLYRGGP